jgi:hypothetical protein
MLKKIETWVSLILISSTNLIITYEFSDNGLRDLVTQVGLFIILGSFEKRGHTKFDFDRIFLGPGVPF